MKVGQLFFAFNWEKKEKSPFETFKAFFRCFEEEGQPIRRFWLRRPSSPITKTMSTLKTCNSAFLAQKSLVIQSICNSAVYYRIEAFFSYSILIFARISANFALFYTFLQCLKITQNVSFEFFFFGLFHQFCNQSWFVW